MKKRYYTAYGSNLNIKQMSKRCPEAEIIGKSEIKNHRLTFRGDDGGYYLTIEPKEGYTVPVGIWKTTAKDELNLDHYENYPILYYKKEIELKVIDKKSGETTKENCYIYIMNEDKNIGEPSEEYVNTCMQGYKDFGFDTEILKSAIEENKLG